MSDRVVRVERWTREGRTAVIDVQALNSASDYEYVKVELSVLHEMFKQLGFALTGTNEHANV